MSSLLEYVARVGILLLFLIVVGSFPWPDIEIYLGAIDTAINTLYFFAPFVPIRVLFFVVQSAIVIELAIVGYKIMISIVNFVASGTWHFGNPEPRPSIGEGSIGGGGYGRRPPGL